MDKPANPAAHETGQATSGPPRAPEPARLTPMMAQYFEIKAANPDCLLFYRMGDFYELFFEDAEIASRALGIVLTKRGKHENEDIRMCGVPIERADDYLQRLIALGHRVAVCEQLEDPAEAKKRGGKSVVKRDVVRLVTPGTITEERLLDPGRANVLLAVQRVRSGEGRVTFGLAALDISTGAFDLSEADEAALSLEIARLEPSEIVAPQALFDDPGFSRLIAETTVSATPLGRDSGDGAAAEQAVREFYGVETLEGFGQFSRAEIAAAALALRYVKRTQIDATPRLAPPTRRARGACLEIDAATRANLELTRTLSGERAGSLFATIDMTATPAGARLLGERLASPLTDPHEINERLDALAFLVEAPALREALRKSLAAAPDFLRALSRLSLDRGGPRDLAALRDGLAASAAIAQTLAPVEALPPAMLRSLARLRDNDGARGWRAIFPRRLPRTCRSISATAASCAPAHRRRSTRRGVCATKAGALSRRCRRATPSKRGRASSRSSTTISSDTTSRRRRRRARRCSKPPIARPSSTARRWPGRCASPPMR